MFRVSALTVPALILACLLPAACVIDIPEPADRTPPRLLEVYPSPGETNAAKNTVVYARFDDPLHADSVGEGEHVHISIKMAGDSEPVPAVVSLQDGGKLLLLQRQGGFFTTNMSYTATLIPGLRNSSGMRWEVETNYSWSFFVVDRLSSYEPTLQFTAPDSIFLVFYAFPGDNFTISGHTNDSLGRAIPLLEYQFQTTNTGNWTAIAYTPGFSVEVETATFPGLMEYPATNRVYFRISYIDSSNQTQTTITNFPFLLDRWTNTQVSTDTWRPDCGIDFLMSGTNQYRAHFWHVGTTDYLYYGEPHPQIQSANIRYYPDIAVKPTDIYVVAEESANIYYFVYTNNNWYKYELFSSQTHAHAPQIAWSTNHNRAVCSYYVSDNGWVWISTNIGVTVGDMVAINQNGTIYDSKMAFDKINDIAHFIIADGYVTEMRYINYSVGSGEKNGDTYLGDMLIMNLTKEWRRSSAICLDDTQQPHIVWFDKYNSGLRYCYHNGSWQSVSMPGSSLPGSGALQAVHIAWYDNRLQLALIRGDVLYHGYCTAGKWFYRKANEGIHDDSFVRVAANNGVINLLYHSSAAVLTKTTSTHY